VLQDRKPCRRPVDDQPLGAASIGAVQVGRDLVAGTHGPGRDRMARGRGPEERVADEPPDHHDPGEGRQDHGGQVRGLGQWRGDALGEEPPLGQAASIERGLELGHRRGLLGANAVRRGDAPDVDRQRLGRVRGAHDDGPCAIHGQVLPALTVRRRSSDVE
jgi:hypothetical protein